MNIGDLVFVCGNGMFCRAIVESFHADSNGFNDTRMKVSCPAQNGNGRTHYWVEKKYCKVIVAQGPA